MASTNDILYLQIDLTLGYQITYIVNRYNGTKSTKLHPKCAIRYDVASTLNSFYDTKQVKIPNGY